MSEKQRLEQSLLRTSSPFDDKAKRDQLQERLQRVSELRLMDAGMEGFPTIPLASLTNPTVMQDLLSTLDWLVRELRSSRDDAEQLTFAGGVHPAESTTAPERRQGSF